MNDLNIEIKLVDSWEESDIVELYKSAGWWKKSYDPSKIDFMIKGSLAFAVAIEKNLNKAVGMGRVISDGVSDAYIQDLVVLPEFRDKRIGKMLTKALLDFCTSKKIVWVGLIAEPNQSGFYSNIGFKILKDYTPMKYNQDD
jgi:ribosomal protein S18 acetylase RimI-like enzyme